MRRELLWLVALLLSTAAGCERGSVVTDGDSSSSPPAAAQQTPSNTLAPEDVKLTTVDGAAFRDAIAGHKGKVVLVDYWATWCDPCRENFPHIVDLHEQHVGDGLAVVSISTDDPEEEPQVRKFLAEQSATFENLLSEFGNGTKSADELDFDGGVPLYKLFDRQGKLRYQFSQFPEELENGQRMENVDERVKELLAEAH